MVLMFFYLGWTNRGAEGGYNWSGFGGWFITWILFAILGWAAFGSIVK